MSSALLLLIVLHLVMLISQFNILRLLWFKIDWNLFKGLFWSSEASLAISPSLHSAPHPLVPRNLPPIISVLCSLTVSFSWLINLCFSCLFSLIVNKTKGVGDFLSMDLFLSMLVKKKKKVNIRQMDLLAGMCEQLFSPVCLFGIPWIVAPPG